MSATPDAMPTVFERSPQPPAPGQPLRLTCEPAAASRQIAALVSKGLALRKHRLRDLSDLDQARSNKKAWIGACHDLLLKLFDSSAVAEACNDWVGRILPEYAPLGLVIEQFYEEMDHRLRRLQAVVDHLDDMAGEEGPVAGDKAADSAAAAVAKKDDAKNKSLNWARLFPTAEEMSKAADASNEVIALGAKPSPVRTAAETKASSHPAPHAASLTPLVKPVGLLLVHSAEEARPVCEFLSDLAVTPRVMTLEEARPGEPELMVAGVTPPAFALVWPIQTEPAHPQAVARFQFQLGFLVGRLGLARVCMVQPLGKGAVEAGPVATITLDAHGGWQLPLARTLKRAGVAVDLNRLC